MVNSLTWCPSGRLLAAALGDGSIGLFQAHNRSLVLVSRLEEAHSGAVASVVFPEWNKVGSETCTAIPSHDRLLCSAGNDGTVVLWDLGASLCGPKAEAPHRLFWESVSSSSDPLESSMKGLELTDQPKALFGWQHGEKPNWMVSTRGLDPLFPSALFIADTTNAITVYLVQTI
jgi:WD40 repeat protein